MDVISERGKWRAFGFLTNAIVDALEPGTDAHTLVGRRVKVTSHLTKSKDPQIATMKKPTMELLP